MDTRDWIRRHKPMWYELEKLLERIEKKPRTVKVSEIDRLTQLYKNVSGQLSAVRAEAAGDEELIGYLNQLVAKSHQTVYREQFTSANQLAVFFKSYFIQLLQKRWLFIGFAFVLFLIGAISAFISVRLDPSDLYVLLPASIADNIDPQHVGQGAAQDPHALLSVAIMTNNMKVAMLAFASGVTFGIWTVYLLAFNGVMVGALAAVFWKAGKSYVFWAYILPHGMIELTAIFIAGGAGLYMGYRMFVPGPLPWRLQLLRSAKESVQLLLGTLPLFVIAGTIEGYITPSALPLAAKYAVAGLTLLLLAAYFVYGLLNGSRAQRSDLASQSL